MKMEEKRNKARKPGGGRKKLKPAFDAGKNLKEQIVYDTLKLPEKSVKNP